MAMVAMHDDMFTEDVIAYSYMYYGRLREEDPVHWNDKYALWVITRHDDVVWMTRRMPVQTFAPMTKDFATFDCDAHVTEPPKIWERAHAYLTRDELEALKATIWWDAESQQLIVNGKAGAGIGSPRRGGIPGTMRVITNAGPGVKHDIQRALNVRNLNPKTALTQEHVAYLDHAGSYEPEPRLQDMDIQGIDQVMIIPTDIDTYPWLHNALGVRAFCSVRCPSPTRPGSWGPTLAACTTSPRPRRSSESGSVQSSGPTGGLPRRRSRRPSGQKPPSPVASPRVQETRAMGPAVCEGAHGRLQG